MRILLIACLFITSCQHLSDFADPHEALHAQVENYRPVFISGLNIYVDPLYTEAQGNRIGKCLSRRLNEFTKCLVAHGQPTSMFRVKVQDYKVYVMPDYHFPCNSSTGYCAGLHIESRREIFLARSGDAWEWELKNAWARLEMQDRSDPDPDTYGIDECVTAGDCLDMF